MKETLESQKTGPNEIHIVIPSTIGYEPFDGAIIAEELERAGLQVDMFIDPADGHVIVEATLPSSGSTASKP